MNARDQVIEFVNFVGVDIIMPDGLEEAFIGVGWQFNKPIAVFDKEQCIEIIRSWGVDEVDALEYFEYNVQGAYVGDQTPIFLEKFNSKLEF